MEERPRPGTGQAFGTTPSVQVDGERVGGNPRLHPHQQGSGAGPARYEPETQCRDLIEAGVPGRYIHADIDVSGAAGVATRNGWISVDSKLKHGDILVVSGLGGYLST